MFKNYFLTNPTDDALSTKFSNLLTIFSTDIKRLINISRVNKSHGWLRLAASRHTIRFVLCSTRARSEINVSSPCCDFWVVITQMSTWMSVEIKVSTKERRDSHTCMSPGTSKEVNSFRKKSLNVSSSSHHEDETNMRRHSVNSTKNINQNLANNLLNKYVPLCVAYSHQSAILQQ